MSKLILSTVRENVTHLPMVKNQNLSVVRTAKFSQLQWTLPFCVLFGHPAHCPCGNSSHIVSYPITKGHTHTATCSQILEHSTVCQHRAQRNRIVSGTSLCVWWWWWGSPHVCPGANLSGVKKVSKGRSQGWRHTTCWFGSLIFQTESSVSSAGPGQISEFPPKSHTHFASPRELTVTSHQEFRIHMQFLLIP